MKRIALLLAVFAGGCASLVGDSSGAAINYPSPLKLRNVAARSPAAAAARSTARSTRRRAMSRSTTRPTTAGTPSRRGFRRHEARRSREPGRQGLDHRPRGRGDRLPGRHLGVHREDELVGRDASDAAVLTVGMWKGTISGSTFTPTGTIVTPTDDPGSHNLHSGADVTVDASYAVPRFSLAAGETLFVELWRHQVAGISDAADANRELDLVVNDGSSKITHPAADDTAPHHVISITKVSGATSFDAGTNTLYYLGSSAGSFKVKDAITDGGSGPLDVTYPLVPTAGWTHPAETITGAPSFTSSVYSWTAGSVTSPGAQSIVAEDNALQTSTATLTLTNDTSGPTGQSVSLNGGPTFSTLSVPLKLVDGTDAGAGVDSASARIERSSAPLTNGSCGTFGSWGTITLAGGADTGVTAGNCYRYRYTIYDRLGNASSPSAAVRDGPGRRDVCADIRRFGLPDAHARRTDRALGRGRPVLQRRNALVQAGRYGVVQPERDREGHAVRRRLGGVSKRLGHERVVRIDRWARTRAARTRPLSPTRGPPAPPHRVRNRSPRRTARVKRRPSMSRSARTRPHRRVRRSRSAAGLPSRRRRSR